MDFCDLYDSYGLIWLKNYLNDSKLLKKLKWLKIAYRTQNDWYDSKLGIWLKLTYETQNDLY